jgi:hypothetical protein
VVDSVALGEVFLRVIRFSPVSILFQSIKIGNRSFESVAKFRYLGTTLTDQIVFMKRLRAD